MAQFNIILCNNKVTSKKASNQMIYITKRCNSDKYLKAEQTSAKLPKIVGDTRHYSPANKE